VKQKCKVPLCDYEGIAIKDHIRRKHAIETKGHDRGHDTNILSPGDVKGFHKLMESDGEDENTSPKRPKPAPKRSTPKRSTLESTPKRSTPKPAPKRSTPKRSTLESTPKRSTLESTPKGKTPKSKTPQPQPSTSSTTNITILCEQTTQTDPETERQTYERTLLELTNAYNRYSQLANV
jgi:hypothetical protein